MALSSPLLVDIIVEKDLRLHDNLGTTEVALNEIFVEGSQISLQPPHIVNHVFDFLSVK
jgi:hypothetical protein